MEQAHAGGGGAPPVDPDAKEKKKRGPHPLSGQYVVLMSQVPQTEGEAPSWIAVTSDLIPASSTKEAKQKAIEANRHLSEMINGDGALLVAVPAMNWQPGRVKAEQPPPIVKGL